MLIAGTELRTLAGHTSGVTSVAISADGRRAVSGSDDSTVKLWDLENGAEVRTLLTSRFVDVVALNWDSRHALIASADQTLKIWDLETGAELRAFARLGSSCGDKCGQSAGRIRLHVR